MSRTNEEITVQIKELIESQVKPAVAQHGGVINFVSYDDGHLMLELSGACAGCAGSRMTLKMGVERLLKANVPELEVVDAVDDDTNSEVKPYYSEEDLNDFDSKEV
jgi:NFU1 iron-sulfur cluster scaffold homolog, mitochondrial